jgi:glutaredoxin
MFGVLRPDGRTERAIFVMDKQGVIRYVDVHDIDQQPDNDELFRVLAEIDPEAATAFQASQPAPESVAEEPEADVVIYCTPWCPDCRKAREYLAQRKIDYVEVDISRDRAAAQRVRDWADGKEVTPTFKIRGEVLVNFDPAKLDAML